MPCKVQVHAFAEAVTPQQGLIHAHHLGTFFINSDRIEIADFHKTVRPHRMGHRPRVFGKLHLAQHAHILDALHRATAGRANHIGGKFLVAEHREAFLQRQLEPVAAGHAVTGPVMKVFMADHRLDIGVIGVGGDAGIGQHILGVEDVEALVFHRAHVEVAHRDDHEPVQIQLQPEAFLIPADAVLERSHRMLSLVQIALLHPHLQQHAAPAVELELFFLTHQLACHQRKQIGRFLERVFPLGIVAAFGQVSLFDQVAIGQQHRISFLVAA